MFLLKISGFNFVYAIINSEKQLLKYKLIFIEM